MSEAPKAFVVTDRRKFTSDGAPRPDADPSPEREKRPEVSAPQPSSPQAAGAQSGAAASPASPAAANGAPSASDVDLPPAPTAEQMEQSRAAYQATVERLDIAVRAANPGMERQPEMNFERLVQSIYMSAIMQLGGGTPEGEQPQIDLMGARQSVDMLDIIAEKTGKNLSPSEAALLESAVFELRLAFLEITQAIARSAAAKAPPGSPAPHRPGPGRPSIVR